MCYSNRDRASPINHRGHGGATGSRRAAHEDGDGLPVPHRSALPTPIEAIVEKFTDAQDDLDRGTRRIAPISQTSASFFISSF